MKSPASRKRDELQGIPGVGPSISRDLRDLGIRKPSDLMGRDPGRLYARLNRLRGVRQDPCVLYVFRCAVYFATTKRPRPELLLWWNWKDRALPSRRPAGAGRRGSFRPA